MPNKTSFDIPVLGYSVKADFYKGSAANKAALFLIGYQSDRARQREFIESLVNSTGYSVLVFDFSGMGDSPFNLDDTTPAQHFLETIYAFDWLKANNPNAELTVIGSSYGGYMAAQLTKYRRFNKLVLRVPAIYRLEDFYSPQALIHTPESRAIRSNNEQLAKHPIITRATAYKGKTLVVVHGKDDAIPKETTDAYIKAFNADVYTQPEFVHSLGDPANPKDKFTHYQQAIANWINNN